MQELILTLFLLAPIVPRNPVAQDTVADANIHFIVGVRPGTNMVNLSPEVGVRIEYLVIHPIVIRASADLNAARVENPRFPSGQRRSADLAVEALIYRGRKRFTSFIGVGAVYSVNGFHLDRQVADPLLDSLDVVKTDIENRFGYRIFLGFRYREHWSMEVGFQETRPEFSFRVNGTGGGYNYLFKKSDLSTLRLTIGYLIPF